ncbi:hypothetical protein SHVI106290_02175 [Shewanella violacea]
MSLNIYIAQACMGNHVEVGFGFYQVEVLEVMS